MKIEDEKMNESRTSDVLNELEPDNPREVSLEIIPRASPSEVFSN